MNLKRHRILYIEKPAFVGGSVISLFELVRGLDSQRYEPVILFYGPNPYREQFRALGAQVITLGDQPTVKDLRSRRDISASLRRYSQWLATGYQSIKDIYRIAQQDWPLTRRIVRLIKDEAIDLVHHNNSLRGSRAGIIAARLAGVPQICHVRMFQDFSWIDTYLARFVNSFIYISRAVEKHFHEGGIPPNKGQVIHNPINMEAFEPKNHSAELRAELGLTDQDWVVSNVGRLDWWKGHDDFLQAVASVIPLQPKIKALIVGESDSSPLNQAYCQRLQQLVANLHLADHVIFTGFRTDIARVITASNVMVHSASEAEPFGRVVVEAMAAGRPVIATAAGGVLDIVEDQVNGLLVPPKNPTLMAAAMQRLLHNQEEAERMGQLAQSHVRERFSVETHVTAVQHIYQQLLTSSKKAG